MLRNGDRAVVVGVQGGHGMQRRMADMGLIPGAEIEVTSDANSTGPVIVRVFEARIAIGRGMARRVMVRPT
ncbi:MAG: ferrous iron transport protein A [Armatimonadetes bacterium]|nr:ferrous iron transport protein A [Armatimonadota bacterium]